MCLQDNISDLSFSLNFCELLLTSKETCMFMHPYNSISRTLRGRQTKFCDTQDIFTAGKSYYAFQMNYFQYKIFYELRHSHFILKNLI